MAAADQDATHGVTVREMPAGFEKAHATPETYKAMYAESINDPDAFWGREGKRLDWIKPYTRVKDTDFTLSLIHIFRTPSSNHLIDTLPKVKSVSLTRV